MAEGDSDSDPLARYTTIAVLGLALLCVLVFSLLMVHLDARDWQELDNTALILLAFLFAILALPFVSRFSIAGLFEFRRDIERLSGEVQGIKNEVQALSSSTSLAAQASSNRANQQLSVVFPGVAETLSKELRNSVGQLNDDAALRSVRHEILKFARLNGWYYFESLVISDYHIRKAESEGLAAVPTDPWVGNKQATLELAIEAVAANPAVKQPIKDLIQRCVRFNQQTRDGTEATSDEFESAVDDVTSATGFLMGDIMARGSVGAGAYHFIQSDEGLRQAFLPEWIGLARKLAVNPDNAT